MEMKYIIGIDGGGTKTECAVADIYGHVLHTSAGKPSNFLTIGLDKAVKNLFEVIEESLFKIEADFADAEMILIGTAGAGRNQDAALLEDKLWKYASDEGIHLKQVKVVSDAEIALEAAFPGNTGCILIAGTGSILFAKDDKNEIRRVGGLGRTIGDEGSGYSIGRKALAAAGKQFDGRGDETLITNLLTKEYNISSSEDLINKVYKENFNAASAAKLVIEAAELGDKIAAKILDEEAEELVLHIEAIKNISEKEKIKISFAGSLIDNENYYSNLLKSKIEKAVKFVEVVEQQNPPVTGAILLAKRILDGQS